MRDLKRFSTFLAAILTISAWADSASGANSDDRYRLIHLGDESAIFVDEQSIVKSGSFVSYWEIVTMVTSDESDADLLKVKSTIDCYNRLKSVQSIIPSRDRYNLDTEDGRNVFDSIAPDSVGELTFNFLCMRRISDDIASIDLFSFDEVIQLKEMIQEDVNAARE